MPGEPRDVAAKPFNSSMVVVNWKPPTDDKQNGVIRAYQIYVQPRNTDYSQPLRFNTGNPDMTSYNVTGLQPDTKYKIQVGNIIIIIIIIIISSFRLRR